jgi:hypothetical protein
MYILVSVFLIIDSKYTGILDMPFHGNTLQKVRSFFPSDDRVIGG